MASDDNHRNFDAENARRTVRVRVEGVVQGVGFRAFVEREALRLDVDGWVRNRRDGGVEAVLSASPDALAALLMRINEGPPAAVVQFFKVLDEVDLTVEEGFQVRPTA